MSYSAFKSCCHKIFPVMALKQWKCPIAPKAYALPSRTVTAARGPAVYPILYSHSYVYSQTVSPVSSLKHNTRSVCTGSVIRSVKNTNPSATVGALYPEPTGTRHFSGTSSESKLEIIPVSCQTPSRVGPRHCGQSSDIAGLTRSVPDKTKRTNKK